MPDNSTPEELIKRYLDGTCTPEEKALMESWHLEEFKNSDEIPSIPEINAVHARMRNTIIGHTQPAPHYTVSFWSRIAVAASVLFVFGTITFYAINQHRKPELAETHDIAPGTAIAILKTGGRIIQLDKTNNGIIAKQNQISITKTKGEQLAYTIATNQVSAPVYDTIQIPAGGRPYLVILSDGSRITLNAATTFRYPERFSKNKREPVELISGELYAEVVHNAAKPFQIKAPGQLITDIGTVFNISAYADEPDSRTTLVTGAVKVSANAKEKTLSPGQQTIYTANSLTVAKANLEQVTAWKDGLFRFNGEYIDVIMRELAHWYNIEVQYKGKMTNEVFYVRITRKRNISEVLKMLEKTEKVHFEIEGRRVIVSSKS